MIAALDLLNEIADRLGYPQFSTIEKPNMLPEHRKLLRLLNRLLSAIGGWKDWDLLRTEGTFVLAAAIQGDSDNSEFVTATQNSDTVTINNVTLSEAYTGWAFQVSGDEEVYRVKSVPSSTSLQLNRAWVSDSITASDEKTFTLAMDRYGLPDDFDRPVDDFESFFGPYNIHPIAPNEFRQRRRDRGGSILLSDPEVYTKFGMTDNQSAEMIHFDPYPEYARLLNFEYQKKHPEIDSDQDKILYPNTYINALVDIMVAVANRDYENSAKMEKALQDAIRSHNLQQANTGPTDSRAQIRPANSMRRSMRVAYGIPGMQIDWGNAFDTGAKHGL